MSDIAPTDDHVHTIAPHGAGSAGDFFALLKPRVMSLVIFTGWVGLIVAPAPLHPVLILMALLCLAVGAGAAGALNMWYDADIDAHMARTRTRPIPRGRIRPGEALGFGVALSAGSVMGMGVTVSWLAAALLAFTIAFYVFVYTMWLKRATPWNIVIGGAAGALAPVIGWVAATGTAGVEPLILFLIIFLWTPPHFWALSLFHTDEYEKVGVPMLPVVAGKPATRRQILFYTLMFVAVTVAALPAGLGGWIYGSVAGAGGGFFILLALRVWAEADGPDADTRARQMFFYSIFHLFALFMALLADHWVPGLLLP